MFSKNKIIRIETVSILLLVVYCFGLSSLFIFHEHDHDHHHHHDLPYCESVVEISNKHVNCSHEAHLNNQEESCFLCDHCVLIDPSVFVNTEDYNIQLVFKKTNQLITAHYLIDVINLSNKSPPYLI